MKNYLKKTIIGFFGGLGNRMYNYALGLSLIKKKTNIN